MNSTIDLMPQETFDSSCQLLLELGRYEFNLTIALFSNHSYSFICDACIEVSNFTITTSEEDVFYRYCLELDISHGCAEIFFQSHDFNVLDLGCIDIPVSSCCKLIQLYYMMYSNVE